MAEYKDAYKFCRFLRSKDYSTSLEKNPPKSGEEAALQLLEEYRQHCRLKISEDRAMDTIQFCFKQGYTEWLDNNKNLAVLTVPKGVHLIGKSYYVFRVGLWDESWKAYDTTKSVLISGTVSTVVSAIVSGLVILFSKG